MNININNKRNLLLLLGVGIIIIWQGLIAQHDSYISNKHKRTKTTGLAYYRAVNLVPFYYFTGYFPLTSANGLPDNPSEAKQIINNRPEDLRTEFQHWYRYGDHSRIFVLMTGAWLTGKYDLPPTDLFNGFIFTLGLIALWYGFWRIREPWIGICWILLAGSSPFYLYETYVNTNIFALPATTAFISIGISLPVLFKKKTTYLFWGPLVLGLIIGLMSDIRGEVLPIIGIPILAYTFAIQYSIRKRALLLLLLLLSFASTRFVLRSYFASQFDEVTAMVENKGGTPYPGPVTLSHPIWHPIWCGLGDYDFRYGYAWSDGAAFNYAQPILEKKLGRSFEWNRLGHLKKYYDDKQIYYKRFEDIDLYADVLRNKVLSDIRNDPIWYMHILAVRGLRILKETPPLGLGFAGLHINIPYLGYLLFPFLALIWYRRDWEWGILFIGSLGLSITPFLIYSGGHATYNSIYTFVVISYFTHLVYQYYARSYYLDDSNFGQIEN